MAVNDRRCHLSLPILDTQGNLVPSAVVTLVDDTGTAILDALYDAQGAGLQNPTTWQPGWVEVYLDIPQRVSLVIVTDTFSTTMVGVDLPPPPTVLATSEVGQPSVPASRVSRALLSDGTGAGVWGLPQAVTAHQHDGTQAGSTILNADTADTDVAANQTWLGNGAGDSLAGALNAALGSASLPRGSQTTLLGANATSFDPTSSKGLAIGAGVIASGEQVALGSSVAVAGSVYLPVLDYDQQSHVYSTTTDTSLLGLTASAAGVTVGFGDTPATPYGVTKPFWLQGDVLVPGTLRTSGSTVIGSPTSSVGFFDSAGVTYPASITGATGALASLLAILASYGLFGGAVSASAGGYDGGAVAAGAAPTSLGYDGGTVGSGSTPSSAGYDGGTL